MQIAPFLDSLGLSEFIGAFVADGVISFEDLRMLDDANMKELGLNIGQRNRLKQALRNARDPYSPPTSEEREKYMHIFNAIDADRSGEIDFDEFVTALKKMEIFQSEMKARQLFDQAGEDRGGTLDRDEFLKLMHGAKQGDKASELCQLTQAGSDVLSKLHEMSGVDITIEDVLKAPVTEDSLAVVRKY